MIKILLDTDIGGDIDDAVCLAYLLKEPRCNLLGITTVCGEPEKRASVADAICRSAGKSIPIVAGLDTTLQPVPVYPTPDGASALERWPHDSFKKADAPAFLYQKIKENPHEVVLIGIGNMTNIAVLFRTYPDAPGLLKGLTVMNGYFGSEPLPDPYYNWNSWADPLASKIVFAADIPTHRVVPLEVTELLTIETEKAGALLKADSDLMRAVFDFGNAWLESAGKLTLHDPLAAVSLFYPDICSFKKGAVQVETENVNDMGGTSFTPDSKGKVEIAQSVDREQFYRILSSALNNHAVTGQYGSERHCAVPPLVASRAKAAGAVGEAWLEHLPILIKELEEQWALSVEEPLSGGTHAYVARAAGQDGKPMILKIDMPDTMGHGDFMNSIYVLQAAQGRGYPKLYACDAEKRACLLERLGKPLSDLDLPVDRQLEIICETLTKTWQLPVSGLTLKNGDDSIVWFRNFIRNTWEELHRPCPENLIAKSMDFLKCREEQYVPAENVLLHGDAHSANILREIDAPDSFKFVDPDGILYEKAYDLGVLMREWQEEYKIDPVKNGRKRCEYLHRLTGADKEAIWQWGFLQTVSTAFVLLQIGQEQAGKEMLHTAQAWCLAD